MKTRIALTQINVTVGDFVGNCEKIFAAAQAAQQQGARLMVSPELALSGYPPEDWLLRTAFYVESAAALQQLAIRLSIFKDFYVVVGHPHRSIAYPHHLHIFNAASVLLNGCVVGTYCKQTLPNTEVFDEKRYFAAGSQPFVFDIDGCRCGLLICEDIWSPAAAQGAKAAGAQLLLILNGSPYHLGKENMRVATVRARICETGLPMVYLNLVGAQDELVFDGASFVLDARGAMVMQMPQFKEALASIDVEFDSAGLQCGQVVLENKHCAAEDKVHPANLSASLWTGSEEEKIYAALMLGVRDYMDKNGFAEALLGLSGGVDSALVLAIACDALGPERVRAIMMPSRYTAKISITDSREMAKRVGVRYDVIPITSIFDAFRASLANELAVECALCTEDRNAGNHNQEVTEENIQARIRGTLLMALSNKYRSIVLTTSNKSELAVGYCTLYGDMAGGLAVIKDIAKTWVYRLCRYRNTSATFATHNIIPERILSRAPSAELRENQTDQDSLPPYEILDAIMQKYMEENKSIADIVAIGYDSADVVHITTLIKANEYKRRQGPLGIRVTQRAFGRDWRYPITSRFIEP